MSYRPRSSCADRERSRPVTERSDIGRVVIIGDALIDEIHGSGSVDTFVGGAALNVAVGLSVLGIPATLLAMVGEDVDGERIRAFLAEHGVTLIATVGQNGSSRAVSDRVNGEPVYVFNEAAKSRRILFGPAERAALDAALFVVVSSFPFDDPAQSAELVAAVRDPTARLVIDPNPRAGMLRDRDAFRASFDRIAPNTLLVKVGDEDSALLYGSRVEELAAHLLADGAPTVLATAGPQGATVQTNEGMVATEQIADLPGPILDSMGAGDATLASIIQSILIDGFPTDESDWSAVLKRAMQIAAATCRSEGALLRLP
jgi:sugar/nucleoside kinase (ribokinase family)